MEEYARLRPLRGERGGDDFEGAQGSTMNPNEQLQFGALLPSEDEIMSGGGKGQPSVTLMRWFYGTPPV